MRHLLATALLCLLAFPAQAARHPNGQQFCRVYSTDAGAMAFRCMSRSEARKSARSFRGRHRVAHARQHHRRPGAGMVTVKTAAGIPITIAARAAESFTGFISELVAAGYRISFMGGWRAHGSCRRCDMHPRGLAIDINQTARNRVTRALPDDVTAMAARHGLTHGAVWRNPDQGHFELAGVHHNARHKLRHRYAAG